MPGERAPEEVRRKQILAAAYEVASREGIDGLTVRAVAAQAGLSHGLIHFHFDRKQQLVHALLDWLLATTTVLQIPAEIARLPRALDRLHALLQQELDRFSHEPRRIRLFLEFWTLGVRDAAIRAKISVELERYRMSFRSLTEEVLQTEPGHFDAMTADGLAAVAVSWIHGCAVQAMIEPEHFDIEEYLTAVRTILAGLADGAVGTSGSDPTA